MMMDVIEMMVDMVDMDMVEWTLSTQPPEIILTNVEGVGDKAKRDVLRRSPVTIGHIAWDEAMVRKEP